MNGVRGLRKFMVRVILELKAGLISTDLARALIYGAKSAAELDQGCVLDERFTELEAQLANIKPNGSAGRPAVRP